MKHIALLTTLLLSASLQAVEKPYDYVFFENSLMKGDYFYSQAKYTSPSWIKNARHHLPVAGSVAFTPGNSLELTYVSAPGGDWYSEIQYCPVRGNDFFREPSTLSLQVQLRESMNAAALPNIAIRYADSTYTQYLNLRNYLKDTRPGVWHSVSIPLKDFGLNAVNDTNIKKLAAVALRPGTADGNEYTIYLDDIELLPASLPSVSTLNAPVLQEAKAYERHIDIKWIVISVILYGIEMIVVPLIENIDIDFCTAGNGLVAIRNFSFGDSSLRIPDNSIGKRFLLRRNFQQNITVIIRGHIKGVFTAFNAICSFCKRLRVCSFNILQVDNEVMFICCNSAAGRTAAAGNAAPGAAPAGFTAAGAIIFLRRRHNNSLITADIYTRGGSRVRVYDLYPIGAGIH